VKHVVEITLFLDVVVFFCVYAIVTLSLNFEQGYAGLFNLGLYFPVLAGALIVAYLPGRLAMMIYNIDSKLDFVADNAVVLNLLKARLASDPLTSIFLLIVTLVAVVGICSLLGYVSAHPALKLSEDYLALFMLSLAESLRVIGMQTNWLAGGVMGITIVNPFWWLGSYAYYGSALLVLGSTVFVWFIYQRLCTSPLGRALKSVRENKLTAECVGKDVSALKKKVLAFSFALLGLGGALHALNTGAVVAEGYSRVDFSFWPWLMMIVGGTGNNLGVMVGTFSLVMMRRVMIYSKHYFTFLPFDVVWLEPILLAVMLGLTLVFKPSGILPEKPPKLDQYMQKVLRRRLYPKEQPSELLAS
jgi:branched-chain amino acid transport system permease protein